MKNRNECFSKCFACWSGYGNCKKKRLPRTKKKAYKKFLLTTRRFRISSFFDSVGSCNIEVYYKQHQPLLFIEPILKKYSKAISKMIHYCDDNCEEFYINDRGRLSWYWDDDNGLYVYDGLMPFCYSKEEAGDTWAFSQLSELIAAILDYPDDFEFPKEIVSDITLLQFINKVV